MIQKKEETGYFSSFDGTKLFYRAWEKETPHSLLIVHGFGEHSGRYRELVEVLGDLPISIFTHDLRGHGHSEGERVFVPSFDCFVKDVYAFRTFIEGKKQLPTRRFIVLGQSLGGLIATSAVLERQTQWQALILLSPFFGVPYLHSVLNGLACVMNLLGPKKIWNNPIRPVFLTHDLEELERFKRDSLVQRRITMHLSRELFRGCAKVNPRARELSIPVLLLAGGTDHIVSVEKSKEFFKKISSQDKTIQIFEDFYHELLHEKNRAQPFTILKNYLADRIQTGLF